MLKLGEVEVLMLGVCRRRGVGGEASLPRRLVVAGTGGSLAKGGPRVVRLLCAHGALLSARLLAPCAGDGKELRCCKSLHSSLIMHINACSLYSPVCAFLHFPDAWLPPL